MTLCSVVGVRPEFVMAAPVLDELDERGDESVLVHTGQHYDESLSAAFFDELSLPDPDRHLGVGSGPRGEQLAAAVGALEQTLSATAPSAVVVYGDTTSTLAGALAAVATGTPVVHVEAGLRSGDWGMPEERVRVVVDHLADLRLAPTRDATAALAAEGVTRGVVRVGDVRADAVARARDRGAGSKSRPAGVGSEPYLLATVHRAATTDDESALRDVIDGLGRASLPVVLPVHPRTADRLRAMGMLDWAEERVRLIDPVGYAAFLGLLDNAAAVATDSGGVQREAAYLATPCVTLRETTEWRETVRRGRNVLVGTEPARITTALDEAAAAPTPESTIPTGASAAVVGAIRSWLDGGTEGQRVDEVRTGDRRVDEARTGDRRVDEARTGDRR